MRFRKYLGEQFSNKENFQKVKIGSRFRKTGLPIISIYFLGHKLDYTKSSAIKVSRQYIDLMTNKIIETKETFIESLTLDSYVIQIPYLTDKRRNDLEILLSVFDQRNNVDKDHHILNVKESDFPEKYRPIIRKLQKAVEDNEVRKKMNMEDGIIDELEDLERTIDDLEQENEIVKHENDLVKQKLGTVEKENETVKQENESVKQKLGTVEQEKDALRTELENLRKSLNNNK
jgi:regulator of replication initiation timing